MSCLFQVTNTTILDEQRHRHASVATKDPSAIFFQDCQFLVSKAIYIESTNVPVIRMANCFISAMSEHPRYNSDCVIDSNAKALFRVWNVTIYNNKRNYTSGNEDFKYYTGNRIVVMESVFAAGIL